MGIVHTEPLYTSVESPVGELLLLGDGRTLRGLHMQKGRKPARVERGWRRAEEPFTSVREQLEEYFAGHRSRFDLPLGLRGTPFQLRVWRALREIPYGETLTYGELAGRIGRPAAARAVGLANGSNPISLIVPCHRLVGANGTLVGYGGGLERKQFLLSLKADGVGGSSGWSTRWRSSS
ncbi:MAG: methylated-DNA--[protein]-cysteine S-methyltransferase [Actinobacteria bacterium]|nr:methylated-DNA--[protein]-cysteine S-methyltransferase [Actinomycetota bacterium]